MWPYYSMNDCNYVYNFGGYPFYFYYYSKNYERIALSFHMMNNVDQSNMLILNAGELCFEQDHAERFYCCVKNSKWIRTR